MVHLLHRLYGVDAPGYTKGISTSGRHVAYAKSLNIYVYILRLILFKEFLNVANEEKLTILGGILFQTFATRSLKSFPACSCGV